MSLHSQLQWRYSTKNFDPAKKLSEDQIQQLLEVLRMSPSAGNTQPWHFLLAQSQEAKERIAKAAKGHFNDMYSRIQDASIALVVCAKKDLSDEYLKSLLALEEDAGRYKDVAQKEELDRARRNSIDIHRNRLGDLQTWMQHQVYLSVGMFLMAAAEMKIDTLVFESIQWPMIIEEFSLEEKGLNPLLIVLAGYRSIDDYNAPPSRPKSRWPLSYIVTDLS